DTSQDIGAVRGDDEPAFFDGIQKYGKSIDEFFLGEWVEMSFGFFDDEELSAVFQPNSEKKPLKDAENFLLAGGSVFKSNWWLSVANFDIFFIAFTSVFSFQNIGGDF